MFVPWKKSCDQPRQCIKKQGHHFPDKGAYSQNYVFSTSHVWMWDLYYKEGWVLKDLCFQIVVLENTLESPLDRQQGDQPNQSQRKPTLNIHWKDYTKAEAPIFGHLMWRTDSWEKTDAEKDWVQEKWATKDEMVGWHHRVNGHEFEQISGDSEGQGSLGCCSPWVTELDTA